MKILELTHFSSGICGVWQRVMQESSLLIEKGHEVRVFSSNLVKSSKKLVPKKDSLGKINITRFPAKKLGGESFMKWDFEKEALKFNPEIIIAHGYRQLHTTDALKIAKKIGAKVFLVTHAPFVEGNFTRSLLSKYAVKFYDKFFAPRIINKFTKIIAITNWERTFLLDLGAKKDKIVLIPNGIPSEFFEKTNQAKEKKNNLLFLGRISPIKNIEVLIRSISSTKNKKFLLNIVGPVEEEYGKTLIRLIKDLNLEMRIKFLPPVYNLDKKIKLIDEHEIFILPSKREAMPQSLVEAMSRGKKVISSENPGSREIIVPGKNGLLFNQRDSQDLANKLDLVQSNTNSLLGKNAKEGVKKFNWKNLINDLNNLF